MVRRKLATEDGGGSWQRKLAAEAGGGRWQRKLAAEAGGGSWLRKLAAEAGGGSWMRKLDAEAGCGRMVSWTSWVCGEWYTGGMALIKIPPTLPHEENYPSCGSVGGIIDSLVATKQF